MKAGSSSYYCPAANSSTGSGRSLLKVLHITGRRSIVSRFEKQNGTYSHLSRAFWHSGIEDTHDARLYRACDIHRTVFWGAVFLFLFQEVFRSARRLFWRDAGPFFMRGLLLPKPRALRHRVQRAKVAGRETWRDDVLMRKE